jgi:predicted DNA-binding transcriptional regulator AlpA
MKERWLSVDEAADVANVSRNTVYRRTSDGSFPKAVRLRNPHKKGPRYVYKWRELDVKNWRLLEDMAADKTMKDKSLAGPTTFVSPVIRNSLRQPLFTLPKKPYDAKGALKKMAIVLAQAILIGFAFAAGTMALGIDPWFFG